MKRLAIALVCPLVLALACAHAETRESCTARGGLWADRCYSDEGDARPLDAIALGPLDGMFGSPRLPSTMDAILGWTVQRGARTTCGDDTTSECTAGPIQLGAQTVSLRFHVKPIAGEPRAYAMDVEGIDGASFRNDVVGSFGQPASACTASHGDVWILDGGLVRVDAKSATFRASGRACP